MIVDVDADDPWIEKFFKKSFVAGLKQVQGQPDEVITAFCSSFTMPIPTKLRIEIAWVKHNII